MCRAGCFVFRGRKDRKVRLGIWSRAAEMNFLSRKPYIPFILVGPAFQRQKVVMPTRIVQHSSMQDVCIQTKLVRRRLVSGGFVSLLLTCFCSRFTKDTLDSVRIFFSNFRNFRTKETGTNNASNQLQRLICANSLPVPRARNYILNTKRQMCRTYLSFLLRFCVVTCQPPFGLLQLSRRALGLYQISRIRCG